MYSNYLTSDELLYALEHEGMEVNERTLRFWISEGILEKPLRKPFKGADGRVRYFPKKVVGEIAQVLRYQEEGWKLTQIKERLRTPIRPTQDVSPEGEMLAKRFLADFIGNGEFKDRQRLIEGADPSTTHWRRIRNFLVARLTHMVGRKQAVRSVSSFMLGLSKRDMARLTRLVNPVDTSGAPEQPEKSQVNVQALRNFLNNRTPPSWEGEEEPEPLFFRHLRARLERLALSLDGDEKMARTELVEIRRMYEQICKSLHFFDTI